MHQIQSAIEVFGFVPVAVMVLSLMLMAGLALSMSIIAED